MRLKSYTDYAVRVLMHLAAKPERLASIAEIARTYRISHNHLTKVVHDLRKAGFLDAVRSRSNKKRHARPTHENSESQDERQTEAGFDLVDCGACVIAPA